MREAWQALLSIPHLGTWLLALWAAYLLLLGVIAVVAGLSALLSAWFFRGNPTSPGVDRAPL